jgi:hypothetical protein
MAARATGSGQGTGHAIGAETQMMLFGVSFRGAVMEVNWKKAQQKAARTARWAMTMTKVAIRRVSAKTRWQLIEFRGKAGGESVGIVDMLAVRKDHGKPDGVLGRGDALQMILIQVKGGAAAKPTAEDWTRLQAAAKRHRATQILLATWMKGRAAQFFHSRTAAANGKLNWKEVDDLRAIFR